MKTTENGDPNDDPNKKNSATDPPTKEQIEQINSILKNAGTLELSFQATKKWVELRASNSTMGTLTIKTKNGIIKLLTTAGTYDDLIKTMGVVGKIGTIFELSTIYNDYKSGEISGDRATYRAVGAVTSFITPILYAAIVGSSTAGPVGTILGITVGVAFVVGEKAYDAVKPQVKGIIWYISNLDLTKWGKWH